MENSAAKSEEEEEYLQEVAHSPMPPPPPVSSPPLVWEVMPFSDNNKAWYQFGHSDVNRAGWMADEECTACSSCQVEFGFFTRRHHCRFCGKIFCYACSEYKSLLPADFNVREPQRTCGNCAAELQPIQAELLATITNQTRELDSGSAATNTALPSNAPVSFSMTAEILKATNSLHAIFSAKEDDTMLYQLDQRMIPEELKQRAVGLAFLTVLKGGFFVSGKVGSGLVIAKTPEGQWSAPSAIGTFGIGWGALVGADITDFVFVLTERDALEVFSGQKSQVALGGMLGITAGPFGGRASNASVHWGNNTIAPVYAYSSQSSGLFAGLALEGAVISHRGDVNTRFYGTEYTPEELLRGSVPQPRAAKQLYAAVCKIFG